MSNLSNEDNEESEISAQESGESWENPFCWRSPVLMRDGACDFSIREGFFLTLFGIRDSAAGKR
jgi:hypothetical protein